MKVKHAKLCLDCDELFSKGRKCPACGCEYYQNLSLWVPPLKAERDELIDAATVEVFHEPWWWHVPLVGRWFRPFDIAF